MTNTHDGLVVRRELRREQLEPVTEVINKRARKSVTLVCPCCGHRGAAGLTTCVTCGAKRVGIPLAPPDIRLPRLGPSLTAIAIPLLVIASFIIVWLLSNDMKVLRVLLVSILGDSTQATREWLRIDPRLLNYRIFAYDGYRLAFYLSAGLIPLSILGVWLARRALRLLRADALRFGGLRIARVSWALSVVLLILFSTATVTSIPRAFERGRERRLAATRAQMYRLHEEALQRYFREYGTYPQDLADLSRVSRIPVPQTDYWERSFSYTPVSVIASKGNAFGFSNYKLVSAGPDGQFGTEVDLTMIDGLIISMPSDPDLRTGWSAPAKPR